MFARAIYLAVLLLTTTLVAGQGNADARVRMADRFYQQMAYARAIEEYRLAAELGAVNEHVTKRLADSYMKLGDTHKAEYWYSMVVKFLNREPEDLYNYAQALKSNEKYVEAEEWMDRYLAITRHEGEPRRSNIVGFARKFNQEKDRYIVRPTSINTPYTDMAPTWLGRDRVVFASSRKQTTGIKRRAAINDEPFLDLYVADVTTNGDLVNARLLEGEVNSRFHEGPATASASGDVLWFTRNDLFKGRVGRSRNGITKLNIYKARKEEGAWRHIEQFLYNSSESSVGHPALSPDGSKLYFVSDMPGGYGGTDIYVCLDMGGQWSEPQNLGPAINTARNELFPFVGADGTLYFASNGHPGLGGLDIYAAQPAADGAYSVAINMGAPVNSPADDHGLVIDPTGRSGFFTSNRPGGKGGDDIYAFVMLFPLEQRFLVTGVVIDEETESPVIDIEVTLQDAQGNVLATTQTDQRGEYYFAVEKDREYRMVARMKGRYDGEQYLSTENIAREQIVARDIQLVPDAGIWLRGAVRRKDRLGFIPGATVSLVNLSSFQSEAVTTGASGEFRFRLQPNEEYEVLFEKEGYFSMSEPMSTKAVRRGVIDLNEARELSLEPVTIGSPIAFRYIRWAEGSAQLDPVARTELDGLAERMLVNPLFKVELAVHTDTRGNTEQLQQLSQRRAQAMMDHLVSKGVPKVRLTARGYGGSQPVNHCIPGVQCSEEEHAENRRNLYTVTGKISDP